MHRIQTNQERDPISKKIWFALQNIQRWTNPVCDESPSTGEIWRN